MPVIRPRWTAPDTRKLQRKLLLQDATLVTKLLVYSAVLVVIPMILVGLISYNRSSSILEREAREFSWQIIEQVKIHVEYYVRDLETDMLSIVNDPAIVKLIAMQTPEEVVQSEIRPDIHQVLKNAAYSRNDISRVTLILDKLVIIDTDGSGSVHPASDLKQEYWYPLVPTVGDLIVSRVLTGGGKQEPVMTIVRRLVDPRTLEPVGMLLMDINYRRLQEIADKVTIGRTGFMGILDTNGHYVYHPDLEQLGKKTQWNTDMVMQEEKGSMVVRTEGREKEFMTFSRSNPLNWHFVTLIPYGELMEGSGYIGRTIIWAITVTMLAAYGLGIAFAASLVRPIRRMQRYMKRVETGDFTERLLVDSKDEIGLLAHGFNKMVEKLVVLLEEVYVSRLKETQMVLNQRETELKMLQSQMNPHFLYNSLETIRGMALDKGMEDIAVMSSSLARLLRYNLRNTSSIVTLKEELDNCIIYLKIQKFRFEDKLDYAFDIPEWAEHCLVPKFSLQPIMENCIAHGIEPSLKTVHVLVHACCAEDDSFVLDISDSGPGMPEATLKRIREDLDNRDILKGGSHIGIANVHRRIVYLFGEEYGITLESRLGHGTLVKLRLPMRPDKQKALINGVEE
jgi:two-component system, sensor histidine kinase YesM